MKSVELLTEKAKGCTHDMQKYILKNSGSRAISMRQTDKLDM